MHARLLVLMMLCGFAVGATGCSPGSIAKRGIKELQGATSRAEPVPGTAGVSFARYHGVQIAPPRTDLGGLVDARFRGALARALREALSEKKNAPFPGGTPTLTIEPEITWYHRAGTLGGLMGSDAYAVALFWLSADGAKLGRIQVVTKSGAVHTGPEDMAESMAKALAKHFKKRRKNVR